VLKSTQKTAGIDRGASFIPDGIIQNMPFSTAKFIKIFLAILF